MRKKRAAITTSVLALALIVSPLPAWAGLQDGAPADPATTSPAATGSNEGGAASTGTAQGFAIPTGFGELFGSTRVEGDVEIGYRFVDVNGSEDKYREQYDLEDGVRILSTRVVISPDQRGSERLFDRVTLSADGVGGDPYEMWNLAAYKTGAYRADARYRSVDYFYGDPGDVHHWDMQREYFDVNLSANLAPTVLVSANFSTYRGSGDRQTTRDFDRDEFHYDEPIDQEGTDYGFGVRWRVQSTDLFFNQQFVNFRDNAGFRDTDNPGGPTATFVEMIANTEVRAMDAPISRGGFHTVVQDRVELFGDLMYSNQQTSSAFAQIIDGIDRSNRPVEVTSDNQGLAERDVLHGNFEARFAAHERVIVTAKYRHRDWDQTGDSIGGNVAVLTETGAAAIERGEGLSSYRVDGDQILFGAEFMPTPDSNIFGEIGYSSIQKTFDKSTIDDFPHGSDRQTDVTTTSVPFRIGGYYRPDQRIDVKITYSHADVDDPLTQVFPTVTDGFRLRSRFRPRPGWTASADFTFRDSENDLSEYQFDSLTFGLGLSYAISERGHASLGYSYLDSSAAVPFTFVLDDRTEGMSVADYEAQSNVFSLSGRYTVSETTPVDAYGTLAYVDNDGSIPLSRFDFLVGARYTFPRGFYVDGQLRFIDYQQEFFHEQGMILAEPEPSSVNDFDATLFTISLGFRFR